MAGIEKVEMAGLAAAACLSENPEIQDAVTNTLEHYPDVQQVIAQNDNSFRKGSADVGKAVGVVGLKALAGAFNAAGLGADILKDFIIGVLNQWADRSGAQSINNSKSGNTARFFKSIGEGFDNAANKAISSMIKPFKNALISSNVREVKNVNGKTPSKTPTQPYGDFLAPQQPGGSRLG